MTILLQRLSRVAPLSAALLCVSIAGAANLSSGLDLPGFDPGVRVQDDLFRAANGAWLNKTEIPADKAEYGTFVQLADLSDKRVRAIVDELAAKPQKPGSVQAKIAAF